MHAAFLIAKGRVRRVDMFVGLQQGVKPEFGFLSLSWALASDVVCRALSQIISFLCKLLFWQQDFESEKYRCCGGARFTWTAIVRMCCLRYFFRLLLAALFPPFFICNAISELMKLH